MNPLPPGITPESDHDTIVRLETHFKEYRDALEERLRHLNELRQEVEEDRKAYLLIDVYDARHAELVQRIEAVTPEVYRRLPVLEKWQARMVGIGIALVVGSGLFGAMLIHLVMGK